MLDLPGQLDLLAEGDQALQDYPELMAYLAEKGQRVLQVLKVLQVFLDLMALMDLLVFLALSPMAAETFCVLPSVPLVHLVLRGCLDSRATQVIKETREKLGKLERRVTRVHLVHQVFQELWDCRAHVVSGDFRDLWEV